MTKPRTLLLAVATSVAVVTGAEASDQLLSGVISSASGQKLEGVTVSAKMEGSTITTSVYTDQAGSYYFPPLPAGDYRVWAQAPADAERPAPLGAGRPLRPMRGCGR